MSQEPHNLEVSQDCEQLSEYKTNNNLLINQKVFENFYKPSLLQKISKGVKKLLPFKEKTVHFDFMKSEDTLNHCESQSFLKIFQSMLCDIVDRTGRSALTIALYSFVLNYVGIIVYTEQLKALNHPACASYFLLLFGLVTSFKIFWAMLSSDEKTLKKFSSPLLPLKYVLIAEFFIPLHGNHSLFSDFALMIVQFISNLH